MKEYWKENWDGWPLHSLIAGAALWTGRYYPQETLLAVNTYFWPSREVAQHVGWRNIWTFHRILEWACPVLVGYAVYYGGLT